MKTSGSPCPLDKISIISFKRCPFLRSFLTNTIRVIWESGHIPENWKKACTVVVHKKGSRDDPANFRPLTLESVLLKVLPLAFVILFSLSLNKMTLLKPISKKALLYKSQGFLGIRTKQHSLVVTLLDLKNAFGEVYHNLIEEVLL